ncbi:MAG: HAD family hydrolase [Pseudomonadota bacterium]
MTIRIAMWSGPRNISTAMMRSWEARSDCAVMDEPFYGAYLMETGLRHPMREEILAEHQTDWDVIADDCANRSDAPIVFQKHMCQHMVDAAPLDWISSCRHAFLIRPPHEVAASFGAKWESFGPDDLGFRRQAELFDRIEAATGAPAPVIEARDVLEGPETMLRALCKALDVPFEAEMLSWRKGRRDTDGVWAEHWYGSVEASTGFATPGPPKDCPEDLLPIAEACEQYYERLARHRLRSH